MDYQRAYLQMFTHLTNLIEQLKLVQQEAEELLIRDGQEPPPPTPPSPHKKQGSR